MSDLLKAGKVMGMDKKWIAIFAVAVVGLLLGGIPAMAAEEGANVMDSFGGGVLKVIEFIFGTSESMVRGITGDDAAAFDQLNINMETGEDNFAKALFLWILPAILLYAILYDFIYLMGFFKRQTAMIISAIFAIFAAKMGVFIRVIVLVGNFLGGVGNTGIFIPMLTITLIMMVIWWTLGHIMWGYKFTAEINSQVGAIDYLDKIGSHLEEKAKNK